ncbi:DUF6173 family protein [Paenibacillus puldeungensis]|uniref:DUF6173 family protein n=1 Tax=Paenibacillus puldeungensis TaxID=696536 RepID=A0ABW3S4E5_9BACL
MSGFDFDDSSNVINRAIPTIDISGLRDHHLADYQYEVITESILDYQKKLDDTLDVALFLASFGQTVLMQVTNVGYSNPSIIRFYGFVNGRESELIQHVSQLSFLLTSTPKDDPNREPIRIKGFVDGD